MQDGQNIRSLIRSSFRFQKMIFYGMGVVATLTGVVLFILTFVLPVNPGEEQIVQVLRVVSVVFVLFGGWSYYYVNSRMKKVLHLVFDSPEEIREIKPFSAQKKGITAFAIRFYTTDDKMVGLNVVGPKTQKRLLQLLKAEIPGAKVELPK